MVEIVLWIHIMMANVDGLHHVDIEASPVIFHSVSECEASGKERVQRIKSRLAEGFEVVYDCAPLRISRSEPTTHLL